MGAASRTYFIGLLVTGMLAGHAASAGPREDVAAAFEHNDYATALPLLRPMAEQGDAMAQFTLGWMYDYGKGTPRDFDQAQQWYRKAAAQGDVFAQAGLARMYDNGFGVAQDLAEALRWYQEAGRNDALAPFQYKLGIIYLEGRGVPKSYGDARKWLQMSADQGHTTAQTILGRMYEQGLGVPKDYVEAQKWFILAASRLPTGDERDQAIHDRVRLSHDMTPAQRIRAQELADGWKPH